MPGEEFGLDPLGSSLPLKALEQKRAVLRASRRTQQSCGKRQDRRLGPVGADKGLDVGGGGEG